MRGVPVYRGVLFCAQATPPENGAAPVCQRCSEDSLAGPQGPGGSAGVISKAQNGHSHGLTPQRKPSDAASFSTTDMCGPDDGAAPYTILTYSFNTKRV